ncbi:MAG: vitamin B12 dependent-methionine synthase activation domain-containing protein [Bacteroidales bacterium]
MVNKTFQYDFNDLKLSVSQIENVIGYKEGEDHEIVTDLIEEILKESQEISNIKAQYTIFNDVQFDSETKSVEISKIRFNIKKIVFGQIKKSDSMAIFLSTAGEEIGIRSRKAMQERDFLRGYIYDVVGSEIVEAAADLMQKELEKAVISTGKKITNRYSPGYCGWDVAEQHKLFQLVPYNYCGIRLTPSALMDPVKSVSGVIGIGENVKYNPYTCSLCDLKDCNYRKIREKT